MLISRCQFYQLFFFVSAVKLKISYCVFPAIHSSLVWYLKWRVYWKRALCKVWKGFPRLSKYYQVLPSIANYCQSLSKLAKVWHVLKRLAKTFKCSQDSPRLVLMLVNHYQVLPMLPKYLQGLASIPRDKHISLFCQGLGQRKQILWHCLQNCVGSMPDHRRARNISSELQKHKVSLALNIKWAFGTIGKYLITISHIDAICHFDKTAQFGNLAFGNLANWS